MAAKKKTSAQASNASAVKKKPVKVEAVAKRASRAKKTAAKSTKRTSTTTAPAVTQDQIAKRAYELWLEHDRPIGRDQAIWLQAERELTGKV